MQKFTRVGMMLGVTLMMVQDGFATDRKVLDLQTAQTVNEVRRELISLPYYSIFDNLSFKVEGETVTLMGKVTRPVLKSDAASVLKQLEGVGKVINEIQVLPLSPLDERLRFALYYNIYGHNALQPLSIRALPPIHIIVENGHVTLEGNVGNHTQKAIAGMQANTVSGVFSVTNNLQVESSK